MSLKYEPASVTTTQDARYTNSYDVFIRGQEICSGAQRVHEPALLEAQIKAKGMPLEPLEDYFKAMRHVAPPHAGRNPFWSLLVTTASI